MWAKGVVLMSTVLNHKLVLNSTVVFIIAFKATDAFLLHVGALHLVCQSTVNVY